MPRLIITCDDYGLCPEVNKAILDCVKEGQLSSVHVLINLVERNDMLKLINAVAHAKKYRGIDCGIALHFNTTEGFPLSENPATLIDEDTKKFLAIDEVKAKKIDHEEVRKEFRAQLNALVGYLGDIEQVDAISSHYNIHFFSVCLLNVILQETAGTGIPFRSTVQWRTGKQIVDPPKYKTKPLLPVTREGLLTGFSTKASTFAMLAKATLLRPKTLYENRDRILATGSQTPINSSGQWFGQPSYECMEWILEQMRAMETAFQQRLAEDSSLQARYDTASDAQYISEVFMHLSTSNRSGSIPNPGYPLECRAAEYRTLKLFKTRTLFEQIRQVLHGVELCSYRTAHSDFIEKPTSEAPDAPPTMLAEMENAEVVVGGNGVPV